MSITLQAGQYGRAMELSNASFSWLMQSLGLPATHETQALLPSQVLTAIRAFHRQTSGYYDDPDVTASIFEYLAPAQSALTDTAIAFLAGESGEGPTVVDAQSDIDWGNLGSLKDPCSEANRLWDKLRNNVRNLKYVATAAQKAGEAIRLY